MNDTPKPLQAPQASPIYDPERDPARIRRIVDAITARKARDPQPPLPERESMRQRKRNARSRIIYAIKTGKLKRPDSCDKCKAVGFTEAHHLGYTKRSKVLFLCPACHKLEHGGVLKPVYDRKPPRESDPDWVRDPGVSFPSTQ